MYKLRADNTSVVVVMLDPPGPPRAQVLRRQKELQRGGTNTAKKPCNNTNAPPLPPKPSKQSKGLSIISRSVDFDILPKKNKSLFELNGKKLLKNLINLNGNEICLINKPKNGLFK